MEVYSRQHKDHPLTAYILLATGMYHWRRGNKPGASRTLNKAMTKFPTFLANYPVYTEEIDFDQLNLRCYKSSQPVGARSTIRIVLHCYPIS